jgi:hypothetical protein
VQEALGMTLDDLDQEWQNSTFGGGRRTLLIYILLGVLLALIVSLGLFVFSRIKQAEVDDWGGDDIPNPDYETDNDLPDNDIDFRLDVDDE